ncbi:GNAT family N-acetyltransferase [Jannaschia sp. 2305UL9-9]|uniref:GNAT family N-acetyltransferase n=1 Tax=Jannaschia sp. 2305UL9-9 TaxID=3121638 RepID=UPI00352873F1
MTCVPTLETARLILRAPRREDFAAFAQTFSSPRNALSVDRPTPEHTSLVYNSDTADWVFRGFGPWSVTLRDGTLIGHVGLQQPAHFPEPEIGWMLHDGYEGQGYATEAATAARDWARGHRVTSLVSYITPGNTASVAVAQRLGAVLDPAAPLPDGETSAETHVYRHWGAL